MNSNSIFDNLINSYNENLSKNSSKFNLELEMSFHLSKNKNIYTNLFNKLSDLSSSIVIHEYINIYYDNNIRITKQFKNGKNLNKDIYLKKTSLSKTINRKLDTMYVKKYNIKLKMEESLTEAEFKKLGLKDVKLVNIKLRLSFILKNNPNFRIDLDLVHNVNMRQNNLKEIKNRIFKEYKLFNIVEDINYELFDELILETEFLNNEFESKQLIKTDLTQTIDFVNNLFDDNAKNNNLNYQEYIYLIAKFIITNKFYLENFKEKSGLKKLLNNVIEMNSEIYSKNIKPQIESYYVTDKIDGQRCIIIYNEYKNLKNIKLITNKIYQISEYNDEIENNNYTILDSEFIINDNLKKQEEISCNDIYLYIFDIIALNNVSTSQMPFEKRLELINDGFKKIKDLPNVNCKEYIRLDNNYKEQLSNFYTKKQKNTNYTIDGLIFIPSSSVLNTNYKYKINTNYNNMIGYKWKPIEEITIDFYIKKLPHNLYSHTPYNSLNISKSDIIYILFSGISKQDFDKLNLTYLANYNKIIPDEFLNKSYFPIQFSTSDQPINYIFISNDTELDNQIGEFNYINDNWELKKLRLDRTVELNRGEYFGNYYKIAELIWNNIKNPLTFEMLISESLNTNYFLIDNNEMYKSIRAYNSYVKTFLLETIINPKLSDKNKTDWLIDLASGKGQDLGRINNLGFKNGLFIDNDKNALLELINRKFSLRTQNSKNMKIFTQEINLTTNYKEIIKKIEKFNINKESIDVIICNFAIHYIIENDEKLLNLIQLLNFYLKPNGRFIFTCFNGKKVFKLLENTQQWDLYDNNSDYLKYSIKKLYTSKNLNNTGQKIDVLLPFSKQKYYTEYLINIDHVNNVFNDNNFTTEISESFTCLLNNFKTNKVYSSLSNQDKEFIDLYQFTILKKNYNNNIIIKSNITSFFNCNSFKTKLDGGLDEEIKDEEIKDDLQVNHLPLDQLNNINNSNAILLFINTIDESIIKYIINNFENMNYKNKNINKRNKNKIVKIIGFEGCSWIDAYKEFYANNIIYDSIIFYDYKFKNSEDLNNYIIKKPIVPIILINNHMLLIISINDLENLLNKENIEDVKFISNSLIDYNLIKDNYLISKNKEIKSFINKYYDSYTV